MPLVAGLYWTRATTQGAVFSIVLGILDLAAVPDDLGRRDLPGPAGRLPDGRVGMVVGSLGPQAVKNRHGSHHHVVGVAREA